MKIHLDLDCYFVSAERTRNNSLKNVPVVVAKGSDKNIFSKRKKDAFLLNDSGAFNSVLEFKKKACKDWKDEFLDDDGALRGIVIAKSYEAKAFGIQTGTSLKEAFCLCPHLKVTTSDHLFYQQLSQKLKEFLITKIPLLEQYSIDEFFGDLDGWIKDEDTFGFIANLQKEIMEKFDLPITIGANRSKWIAKLITDKIKPYGIKVVKDDQTDTFTNDIPVEDFPGIGRAIQKELSSRRIKTLKEIKENPWIITKYGKMGNDLYKRICGTDNEKISASRDRRSIGISRNFKAINDRDEIRRRVVILSRYLSYTIIKLKLNPTSFYLKIKYEQSLKQSLSLRRYRLFSEKNLIDTALFMLDQIDVHKRYKVHYIALHVSNFTNRSYPRTLSLLEYENDKKLAFLSQKMTTIREKYGIDSIKYGCEEMCLDMKSNNFLL
jgi:DNA polymerase-4